MTDTRRYTQTTLPYKTGTQKLGQDKTRAQEKTLTYLVQSTE